MATCEHMQLLHRCQSHHPVCTETQSYAFKHSNRPSSPARPIEKNGYLQHHVKSGSGTKQCTKQTQWKRQCRRFCQLRFHFNKRGTKFAKISMQALRTMTKHYTCIRISMNVHNAVEVQPTTQIQPMHVILSIFVSMHSIY